MIMLLYRKCWKIQEETFKKIFKTRYTKIYFYSFVVVVKSPWYIKRLLIYKYTKKKPDFEQQIN